MAAARHNRPTIVVYGGTISPGVRQVDCPSMGFNKGGMVNIGDAFESYGNHVTFKLFKVFHLKYYRCLPYWCYH